MAIYNDGDDTLDGGLDADSLLGGPGNDTLNGGLDADILNRAGDDVLIARIRHRGLSSDFMMADYRDATGRGHGDLII